MLTRTEYEKRFPDKVIRYEDLVSLIKEAMVDKLLPHRMDSRKVEVLSKIARLNLRYEWVKVQQDVSLVKQEEKAFTLTIDAVHATRLTWFGLLERKERRSGLYKVTEAGILFLKGIGRVPKRIYVRKGVVHDQDPEMLSVHDVKGVILDRVYWNSYPLNEQYRESTTAHTMQGRLF